MPKRSSRRLSSRIAHQPSAPQVDASTRQKVLQQVTSALDDAKKAMKVIKVNDKSVRPEASDHAWKRFQSTVSTALRNAKASKDGPTQQDHLSRIRKRQDNKIYKEDRDMKNCLYIGKRAQSTLQSEPEYIISFCVPDDNTCIRQICGDVREVSLQLSTNPRYIYEEAKAHTGSELFDELKLKETLDPSYALLLHRYREVIDEAKTNQQLTVTQGEKKVVVAFLLPALEKFFLQFPGAGTALGILDRSPQWFKRLVGTSGRAIEWMLANPLLMVIITCIVKSLQLAMCLYIKGMDLVSAISMAVLALANMVENPTIKVTLLVMFNIMTCATGSIWSCLASLKDTLQMVFGNLWMLMVQLVASILEYSLGHFLAICS